METEPPLIVACCPKADLLPSAIVMAALLSNTVTSAAASALTRLVALGSALTRLPMDIIWVSWRLVSASMVRAAPLLRFAALPTETLLSLFSTATPILAPALKYLDRLPSVSGLEAAAAVPTVFASTSFFTSCSIPSTPSSNGMFSSSSSISPFPFTESPAAGAGFLPVKLLVTERLFRERVFWASISRFPSSVLRVPSSVTSALLCSSITPKAVATSALALAWA